MNSMQVSPDATLVVSQRIETAGNAQQEIKIE